jgi:hypothetical protein
LSHERPRRTLARVQLSTTMATRRELILRATAAGVGVALAAVPEIAASRAWATAMEAEVPALVRDTLEGVAAFVLPGPDRYSELQGVVDPRPGAVAAGAAAGLVEVVDALAPVTAPGNAATVAAVLNAVAPQLNPLVARSGAASPFARLSFSEKLALFTRLDRDPAEPLRFLAAFVPALVALISYSEYGVLDRGTRRLRRRPVGWTLCGYEGVADGRDELRGYYHGRRRASRRTTARA